MSHRSIAAGSFAVLLAILLVSCDSPIEPDDFEFSSTIEELGQIANNLTIRVADADVACSGLVELAIVSATEISRRAADGSVSGADQGDLAIGVEVGANTTGVVTSSCIPLATAVSVQILGGDP